ncbi:MAG: S8 family serine peptidase [Armatimonadota bacterium]
MFKRSFPVSLVVFGLASVSFGQFTQVAGVREFTGQLIVRPKQVASMMDSGVRFDEIRLRRQRSRSRVASMILRYVPQTDEYILKVPIGLSENMYSNSLMGSGDYEYVQPNWRVFPTRVPNDPRYAQQWHHPVIGSPRAWDLWTGSSTRTIAFCDTGIMRAHEDLKNLRIPGYNAVDKIAETAGGQVEDINGHGTHVSGCGAAQGNNGIGVSGVGWNFKIMHCRVSNSAGGGAFTSDMMDGARWAIEHGAKTVSVSYSGVDAPTIGTTGTYIKSIGGLMLFAAGNDNRDLTGFRHPDTIVVGSTNESDTKSDFSAYGRGCTLFAPGSNILSTTMDGSYQFFSGTSMATPVANGALATIWSVNPDLTPNEVSDILFSTCDNIGPSTIFGYGRVNVHRGVNLALATLAKDADVTAVAPVYGDYTGGGLSEVKDSSLISSYNVKGRLQAGVGPVASASVTGTIPAAASELRSVSVSAAFNSESLAATTVFVYAWNSLTSAWDLQGSRGTYGGVNNTISFSIRTNLNGYVDGAGQVKLMFRAVTPARLSQNLSNLRVSQVKVRYTKNPTTP